MLGRPWRRHQQHKWRLRVETSPPRRQRILEVNWHALQTRQDKARLRHAVRLGPKLEKTVTEIVDFMPLMQEKYPRDGLDIPDFPAGFRLAHEHV